MILKLLMVMLGGGVGSAARFLIQTSVIPTSAGFPAATLAVNFLGCLGIGLLGGLSASSTVGVPGEWRLFIMTGLLGGFTTFSAFGLETVTLLLEGAVGRAIVYVALSNALGIGAAFIGYQMVKGG